MKNNKGFGLISLLLTVLILALLAVFMLQIYKPAGTATGVSNTPDAVQQAQDAVDALNDRLEGYKD